MTTKNTIPYSPAVSGSTVTGVMTSLVSKMACLSLLCSSVIPFYSVIAGEDRTWTGAGDGRDWFDAANWQPAGVPGASDSVTIGNGKTVVLTNSTEMLSSLSISSTLMCSNWTTCVRSENISLLSGAVVRPVCGFTDTGMSNRVWIVANSLNIASGATINANSLGYLTLCGPGWAGLSPYKYAGGSYGGKGANGSCAVYGDIRDPQQPGTGGGSQSGTGTAGGAILIQLSGDLVLNGTITARSSAPQYWVASGSGGAVSIDCRTISGSGTIDASAGGTTAAGASAGGGGGRIAVRYDAAAQDSVNDCEVKLIAHGSIARNTSSERCNWIGEPGTVYCTDARFLSSSPVRIGGAFYCGDVPEPPQTITFAGDAVLDGVYFRVMADNAVVTVGGDLCITGTNTRVYGLSFGGSNPKLEVGGDLRIKGSRIVAEKGLDLDVGGNLLMSEGATVHTSAEFSVKAAQTNSPSSYGATIDVAGDWRIEKYGVFYPACEPGNGSIVTVNTRTITVDEGAEINANSAGWKGQAGLGASMGIYSRGASHGGRAGNRVSHTRVGTIYGSETEPLYPGSGCWHRDGNNNTGGGVVFITTKGRARFDGNVTANGGSCREWIGGASGGSIYIRCGGTLSGSGIISANGGAGAATGSFANVAGGGGGGGRVAIYYANLAEGFDKSKVTASGGLCNNGTSENDNGEDGTVYWCHRPRAFNFWVY